MNAGATESFALLWSGFPMRKVIVCATLLALLAAAIPVVSWAEAPPPSPSPGSSAVRQGSAPTESRITEYRLPPDKLRQAMGLDRIRKLLYGARTLYGFAMLLLFLELRIGSRFRDWAEAASRRRFTQIAIFAPLLLMTLGILGLPLSTYGHHLQTAYGFSVQGWASWLWDWTKGQLVNIVLLTLLAWGFYAILRRMPERWWICAWVGAVPVIVLLVFLHPLVIDPMFNKFDPLEARQPGLVEQIEKVVQRGGLEIPHARMFEMRASEKVTTYNAYVTGIGASKRVVVWDNTARDLTVPQTLSVFGHEQGHYVLNHIWIGVGGATLGLLAGLYLAHRTMGFLLARRGTRWGIRELSDLASLPAFLLLVTVLQFVTEPVSAGFSRYLEHQADIYALEVIHGLVPDSSQAAAQAFQRLGEKGLAVPAPDPLFAFWTYSHPPIADRIRFALSYQPWTEGKPPRYIKVSSATGFETRKVNPVEAPPSAVTPQLLQADRSAAFQPNATDFSYCVSH